MPQKRVAIPQARQGERQTRKMAEKAHAQRPRETGQSLGTIFTAYKPESDVRLREIQSASRKNWTSVFPEATILDVADRNLAHAVRHVDPKEVCLWVNADLLFDVRLRTAVEVLARRFPGGFLAVGQRIETWPDGRRTLGRVAAMDYFAFTAQTLANLPSVAMGRGYCDSAILTYALRQGVPTVDLSYAVVAVHQFHGYAHLEGGKRAAYEGAEAQANLRGGHLRPYPPNIVDCAYRLTPRGMVVRNWRRPTLRRLEAALFYRRAWRRCPPFNAIWNRLTGGGRLWWNPPLPPPLEQEGRVRATYATRAGLSYWTPNHAPVQNVLFAAENTNLELHVAVGRPRGDFVVPQAIARRCAIDFHRSRVGFVASAIRSARRTGILFTGFDYPCLLIGYVAAKLFNCRWVCFVWDPPVLWLRDRHPFLRKFCDFVFKRLVRTADRIVLQIHPGLLLEEMSYRPSCAEQVVFSSNGLDCVGFGNERSEGLQVSDGTAVEHASASVRLGVLASPAKGKGFDFLRRACAALPGVELDWVGATGFVEQSVAHRRLAAADILVYPYLNVPSLRWNFALKLYEYAAFGKPIVCADLPGARKALNGVPRVFYFAPGEFKSFAKALSAARRAPRSEPFDLSRLSVVRVHAELRKCLGLMKKGEP